MYSSTRRSSDICHRMVRYRRSVTREVVGKGTLLKKKKNATVVGSPRYRGIWKSEVPTRRDGIRTMPLQLTLMYTYIIATSLHYLRTTDGQSRPQVERSDAQTLGNQVSYQMMDLMLTADVNCPVVRIYCAPEKNLATLM